MLGEANYSQKRSGKSAGTGIVRRKRLDLFVFSAMAVVVSVISTDFETGTYVMVDGFPYKEEVGGSSPSATTSCRG